MTNRSRPVSAFNRPNRRGVPRSLAKFLTFCLLLISSAVSLSENALGRTLGGLSQRHARSPRDAGAKVDDEKEARLLEPGKTIKRELAGGDSHTYQIRLSAGQFVNVIVEQQGIDVVARLVGPDGEQIAEIDRERWSQGQESAPFVAESEGAYRLTVLTRLKTFPAGDYEIRIEELRDATEDDRALQEARKLIERGSKLRGAGKYEEALPLFERGLEIRERVLGPDHCDVAEALNRVAVLYWSKSEYAKAEPLFQRALGIREKALGPEHPIVAVTLNDLANVYKSSANYGRAEALYQRALSIMEKTLGPDHPNVAAILDNLYLSYCDRGEYAIAEPLEQRSLAIREKVLGPEHLEVAISLNNLAKLHCKRGDCLKSEPLYQRALTIFEKELGQQHPYVASTIDNLAVVYQSMAEYAKAEHLYQRSLAIREKALGPEHPEVAVTLNNLANIYIDGGEYLKAEPLHQRALAIREKAQGPAHPDVAQSLKNLGILYSKKGDYAKAEQFLQRSLAIAEKALGPYHISIANTLDRLSTVYYYKINFGQAERLLRQELAIWEKSQAPDHPEVAIALNKLGVLYRNRGDYLTAESLLQRSLAIKEKALGPDHPSVAYNLNDLAILYRDRRHFLEAQRLFQRALTIREKALRPEHPDIAESLDELAVLYAAKGDFAQAVTIQSRANFVSESSLASNLATGSERHKLACLALFSNQTDFTLSLHSRALPRDAQALDLAFTTLLRRKGRGLDVMADTIAALRRRAAPEDKALFDRLAEARSQLAVFTFKGSGTDKLETYLARLKLLGDRVEELESALSARNPDFRSQAQSVTMAAVQSAIPAGGALVEFAVYTPQDPRNNKNKLPPRYLAYLLAAQGRPRWIDLGEAAPIDRAITAWRQALRNPRRTDVNRLARAVDEKVTRPVLALAQSGFGAPSRLLIAPDGLLNLIPFAALVDRQGRYLVERYSISYLTSGRDLLRPQTVRSGERYAVIVADPDYGAMASAVASRGRGVGLPSGLPQSAGSRLNVAQIYFPPLKGTAGEARALKAILPRATVFTRERATEGALKQLHSPSVLHVATHGFFLQDQDLELVGGRHARDATVRSLVRPDHLVENPLLRSGLALAGVNQRLGRADQGDDGILTALEAAGLDLWGTKLVALSACDTGVGEVKNGEGVFGLRRALALAGSETQVMSLWPVSDLGARDFMIEYYKALRRGDGRGDGLRHVQLELLKRERRRHPFYWASFIQSGEWANLAGKR
jgi:CHAT domain-containing protein/Tfp pilus assembly protein PilF